MTNESKLPATESCNASKDKASGHRKNDNSISSLPHHPIYLSSNRNGYLPSYNNHVYYPGSYNYLSYSSTPLYSYQMNIDGYNKSSYPAPRKTTTNPPPTSHLRDCNRFNSPSPLTTCATKSDTTLISHAKVSDANIGIKYEQPMLPKTSQSTISNEYVDPKILAAAHALKLPPGGQKYSVQHWKSALALCYRWKTTTNEDERKFYRKSTATNSLSSVTLKSIKFFCENILQRKTKRRQFAIHWKESGLKSIVDESASSGAKSFEYNDPKLEKTLDDYFSGRTRSSGYNQAKERALEDRQKEILCLWDELMSGPVLSDASSHQKLYLLQLAIERPYRNKKVEIETKDKKLVYDVSIDGYGGKSYWEGKNPPNPTDNENQGSLDEELPCNETMTKRFWKSAESPSSKHQAKKRRLENDENCKNSQLLEQNAIVLPKERFNRSEYSSSEDDKENKTAVAV